MEKGKLWRPPPLSPLTDLHQNLHRWLVDDIYHPANFYLDRIRGFASAHARLRAPLFTRLFFGSIHHLQRSLATSAPVQRTCSHTADHWRVPRDREQRTHFFKLWFCWSATVLSFRVMVNVIFYIACYELLIPRRSGMARVNEASHSFTCQPHVYRSTSRAEQLEEQNKKWYYFLIHWLHCDMLVSNKTSWFLLFLLCDVATIVLAKRFKL